MYGRVTRQQCSHPSYGGHGVFAEAEQVPQDSLIQLNSHGINCGLMEGLKLAVPEVLPDC